MRLVPQSTLIQTLKISGVSATACRQDCKALAGISPHAGTRDVPKAPHAPAYERRKEWAAAEHGAY